MRLLAVRMVFCSLADFECDKVKPRSVSAFDCGSNAVTFGLSNDQECATQVPPSLSKKPLANRTAPKWAALPILQTRFPLQIKVAGNRL
jgi:hypothetical protein